MKRIGEFEIIQEATFHQVTAFIYTDYATGKTVTAQVACSPDVLTRMRRYMVNDEKTEAINCHFNTLGTRAFDKQIKNYPTILQADEAGIAAYIKEKLNGNS